MRVVTQYNNIFLIKFQFMPSLVEKVKKLPDRKWDARIKAWTVPVKHYEEVKSFAEANKFVFNDPGKHIEVEDVVYPEVELPELKMEIPLKMSLFNYQRTGVAYILDKKRLIVGDQMGLGKAQPLNAKILTPTGWTTMGEINVGDRVIGSDGKACNVVAVFPQGEKDIYRISMSDGSSTECCKEHLWKITTPYHRLMKKDGTVRTLEKLMNEGFQVKNGNNKYYIPIVKPVEFDQKRKLPLHPYLLGVLIGDGGLSTTTPDVSLPDEFIKKKIETMLPNGVSLKRQNSIDYRISKVGKSFQGAPNPLTEILKKLDLCGKHSYEKHIPDLYKFASVENRIQLLNGLMDTDGWVNYGKRGNAYQYCTSSDELAIDFAFLVQSLGGVARSKFKKNDKRGAWIITVSLNFNPFTLPRKADGYIPRTKYFPSRAIIKAEYVGRKQAQCILVNASDHLYVTDDFIVTHNTAESIAAVTAANAFPCLVICPASLKINWQREWEMWTNNKALILNDTVKRTFRYFYETGLAKVFIVNYESLKKYFVAYIEPGQRITLKDIHFNENKNFFKSVIIDEAHRIKDPKSQQSKFTRGICDKKEWILALTGTPVVNKPTDLASELAIIGRIGDFGGYRKFMDRYQDADQHLQKELNYKLKSTCFIRRDKSEATDLPEKTRQVVMCDITTQKEYKDALKDLEGYLKKYRQATDDQVAKSMRGEVMVRIGILKNISARGKLHDLFEFIDDTLANGEKLVVFGHLKEVLSQVKKRYRCVSITGEDGMQDRQASIDKFQNDPGVNLIVCSIAAAGVGITLTASSTVAFIEMGWHPAIMEQCEDRCHRISQKNNVNCVYFLGKGTIDEWVYKLIDEKRTMSDTITGAKDDVEENIMYSIIDLFNKKYEL